MAIAVKPDGSALVSGGSGRNEIYLIPPEGLAGNAGGNLGASLAPLQVLPYPIFDLAFDSQGNLWATTGGNGLLKLNAETGAIVKNYGESITQTLAIDAATGVIYVSSANGVEIFDPTKESFSHFSDIRVGNLAFDNQGNLWGATWPDRGDIIRFDQRGKAQKMLEFNTPVDSLSFGKAGTKLEGLLFISNNSGVKPNTDSQLIMVDVATLRQVSLAKGGSRGDIIKTTADGRILLSQSHQIDVISPLVAPRVAYTNPAPNANLTLPENTITVVFDQDMLVGTATDAASILNPANYQLSGQTVGNLTPLSVIYDPATRSALLNFEALIPDQYELRVENSLRSKAGLAIPEDYITKFTAISDFLPFVNFQFNTPRSDRANQTVSYDVTITSKGDSDLLLPLVLLLDPSRQFTGQPLGASGQNGEGAYLIDLSDSLPNGRLKPGQSITGKVINVKNPDNLRVDFTPGLYALPYPNLAPNFTSSPVINAIASQPYTYQVKAQDPDGVALAYLLYDGPDGMTLNATTGVINWTPTATSAAETPVTLRVYDSRGGYGTQSFKIKVEGGNHKPILQPLPTQIEGQEGESLQIGIAAIDEDNNPLIFWADNLPGGAVFDGTKGLLTWTPNYEAAGTYENVTFFASDGSEIVSQSTQIRIAPTNQAPTLIRPSDRIVREGDKVRMQLTANDPEAADLKYLSNLLPGGAKLDPKTGLFEWTPAYFQAGEFEIPFSVSDGEKTTKQTVKITVLNANAVPVFDEIGTWQIQEGQLLYIQPFAFDPDNPSFALPFRLPDGSLTPLEGGEASVTYTVSNLPHGATFDADTATLKWTPDFTSAGNYTITVTATDDGNGTGNNASASINIPIRVENTNRIPEITPIPNQTLQRGEVVEIPIQVTDPDGNPIVITAQGLPGFSIPSFATFTDNKDGTGLLRFAPSLADDSGDYTITLKVRDDGDGGKSGIQTQEYTFIVSVDAPNDSPKLSRISDQVAVVGTPLQFVIEASDKNQDNLNFSAIGLPTGATLTPSNIYGKAIFSWTPTASSLGSYPITIKVTDSGNGDSNKILSDPKAFNLVVRNSNQNPVLAPITSQTIDEGKTLQLTVSATDSEGDSLTYTATNLPQGAILEPVTGSLTWTPKYADAGTYKDIAITATDGNKSSTQLLTIQVNNVNQKPVLIPVPIQAGREKSAIQFFLSGNDADGDSLSYSAVTKLPDGAFFDTRTQQFRWTPGYEQAGEYKVRFAVFDPQGASDTIDVTLKVDNVNRSPSLKVSNHNAVLGKELKFNLIGSDPDLNTTLTYSIKDLPEGATFNPKTGEFSWLPNPGQVGDYPLTFGVSDGESSVTERVLIHAAIAPEPLPVTIELTPSFPAIPGQKVLIHAMATSLADIATINLSVNGQPLTLDSQGRGEFTPNTPGQYLVTAKATDVDGFAGQTTSIIKVRNPQDNLPPVVAFLNDLEGEKIANVTSIVGTVADLNLDEWSLELASLGSNDYVKLAGGNQALATAPLTQLDPTTLSNGFYQLKLKATDISGRTSFTTAIIEINTSQKSSQYQRSETDLTVTLEGVNLDLIRVYDSLNSSHSATFGHGWRLGNTDTQIQTNVPLSGRENLGVYNPFRVGTRLYLTLPNGERVGFTFQPQRQEIPGLVYYTPAWVADTGVNYTLQSQDALLSLAGERLYELKTGQPYNPTTVGAQALHPVPSFTLTAPDGTIYHLDATGKVQAQIAANRVKLTYSDSGIISPSGELVSFIQDAEGRLSQISAPDGRIITYKYDAQGNLINARNLALAQSNYYSYAADHRLTLVAAANQPGATISYNIPQPQVTTLTGNLGSAFQFNPTVTQGEFKTGEIQRYSFSVRQSEVNSTATGIVLLGVEVKGNNIEPNLPVIQRLTPLSSQLNSNSAFSLFAVDQEGLNLLEVQGKTGNYSLQMFVAGDVNQDGLVDGVDGQLLTAGLGRKVGEVGYSLNLDVNRDGTINATDVQILGSNFGFKANQAPVVKTTSLLTHEDLQVTVPLINLAEDLEGDEVFYRVLNPVNGTVGMTPNGKGAIFTPSADYTGTASFELIADDGFSSSQPVTVTVNVSDAPLQIINITPRSQIIAPGDSLNLTFTGDFADQKGVSLPAAYLTLKTLDETIAQVSNQGRLTALDYGSTIVTASRGNIQAITPIGVDIADEEGYTVFSEDFIQVFPEAITLAGNYGTRQLLVDEGTEVGFIHPDSDVQLFVGNPNIVSIGTDGVIKAIAPGVTTITAIKGLAESVIPVLVQDVPVGAGTINQDGGAIRLADGTTVVVPKGALQGDVTVSIAPITQDNLPIAFPEDFTFGGAFKLNLGDRELDQAVQLAIPATPGTPEGTKVYFFQESSLPDATGIYKPVWLLVEKGEVGNDGFVRTSSPPYPGITSSDTYLAAYETSLTGYLQAISLAASPGGAFMAAGLIATYATLAMPLSPKYKQIEVISIPRVGLPIVTTQGIEIKPGSLSTFETPITPPPDLDLTNSPLITSLKVEVTQNGPELVITGDRFTTTTGRSSVVFRNPNGTVQVIAPSSLSRTVIRTPIPNNVVIGLTEISVKRLEPSLMGTATGIQTEDEPFNSNPAFLQGNQNYFLSSFSSAGSTFNITAINRQTNDIVAKIPLLGGASNNGPRYISISPDLTRAYVPLTSPGVVSVIDIQALQEVDLNPQTSTIDPIQLPNGATPFWSTIDDRGDYLYITDHRQPVVYVVDIRPNSPTYNRVDTININSPFGLRKLAINSDGTRLYVAAPSEESHATGRQQQPGKITIISLDPSNPATFHRQISSIQADREPYAIIPTSDPNKMLFTNASNDRQGFGIIEGANVRYLDLTLGDARDYFDVNNANGIAYLPKKTLGDWQTEDYAFVSAYNSPFPLGDPSHHPNDDPFFGLDPYFNPRRPPNGGNVGIIRDPLGNPQLIAATRPINWSVPLHLALSADGKQLFLHNRGFASGVYIYSIEAMLETIKNKSLAELAEIPIDGFYSYKNYSRNFRGSSTQQDRQNDLRIDLRADFTLLDPNTNEPFIFTSPRIQPKIGVPAGSQNAPLTPGGYLAAIDNPVAAPLEIQVSGKFGDIIDLNLPELLNLQSNTYKDFQLSGFNSSFGLDFSQGKVATYRNLNTNNYVIVQPNLLNNGTFATSTTHQNTNGDGIVDFADTGIFYFVPEISDQDFREKIQQNKVLNNSSARISFSYTDINSGQNKSGIIDLQISDFVKDTNTGNFTEYGYIPLNLIGSVGNGQNYENRPLDVYRVQQRLKYLGFPASNSEANPSPLTGGNGIPEIIKINGNFQQQRSTFQNVNRYATETALRLFQSSVSSNVSSSLPRYPTPILPPTQHRNWYVVSSGQVDQDTLSWLNADNAPRWVELIDPPPGTRNPLFATNGGDFDILPGGNRDGRTQQTERFGTNWTISIIENATRNAPGTQIITGISENGFTRLHNTHKAGNDIDVAITFPLTEGTLPVVHPGNIGTPGQPGFIPAWQRLQNMTFNDRLAWYLASQVDQNGDGQPETQQTLSRHEKIVITDMAAFYIAAGADGQTTNSQWVGAFIGNTNRNTYARIREVLDALGDGIRGNAPIRNNQGNRTDPSVDHDSNPQTPRIASESVLQIGFNAINLDPHENHFHVILKPPVRGVSVPTLTAVPILLTDFETNIENDAQWNNIPTSSISVDSLEFTLLNQKTIATWNDLGIKSDQFNNIEIQITDLPDNTLALTEGLTIKIDRNAAGHGWFIDSTPSNNLEFDNSDGHYIADTSSPAYGKVDLLTVLTHELGHILGLSDLDSEDYPNQLMSASLPTGVRRLPTVIEFNSLPSPEVSTSPTFNENLIIRNPQPYTYTPSQIQPTFPITVSSLNTSSNNPVGILNPNFSISNPNDTQFGWTTQGAATVSNGIATFGENSPNNARFSQTFLIPNNATTLQFTILNANLGATSLTPPDAFEVALLNANTLTPLVGTSSGLNNTDAFLNLQKNGQIYLSPQVSLNSPNLSNSPITVSVDLTGIAAGTAATLYFDLLGFGQREASVSIDNVLLLTDNPNLPPTSLNDSITTPEDTSITIPVLNNDTDDGTLDPTSLAIISNPSQGQIQLNPDGTITYTPKPNFNGTDTFSYTVKDDIGQTSNSATVTVTVTPVNDLPTLTNDSITLNQGSSVTFSVLSNDTDIDGTIDATTLAIATNPTHGQLQLNPDATFTYTPNPNFSGTDTFTYTVKDNGGQISQPATVTLTVNNLPPTITNLIGDTQIKEGDQAGFQAIATDPGNDTLSYSWNFGDGSNPVTGQSVNHKFADNGSYVVTLTVTDTFGASTSQNLNVNVANVAPTVNAGSDRTATQGTAVTLAGNFTDPGILDTHSLTWDFGDGTTASNTLTPTHIYTTPGDYTVTLTVTDKDGAIISDTLNLSVTPTTELPTVAINDVTIKEKDGITSARFTVTLSQASNQAITVNFNTSDGTAKAGIDYLSRQGQISFAAGETSKTLEITLKTRKRGDIDGDGDIDRDDLNLIVAGRNTSARIPQPNQKTFFLNLGDITGATLLDNQGTGILLSDGLDPRDLDGDGLITVLDARILAVLMRS